MVNDFLCAISLVIPVYGSEQILPELVTQIDRVMRAQAWSYEIILVCDQSPDQSWQVIQSLVTSHPGVRGVLLRKNMGQHNALMAGFLQAKGKVIVAMDDDLQHSPIDIPLLIEKIEEGYDVVYANFKARKHPLWKTLGSRLNNIIVSYLIKKPRHLYLSPFKAFKAAIGHEILHYKGPHVYVDGLLLSVTRNIASIDVDHYDRFAGNSYYGLRKSLSLWLKMAKSLSIIPLRITSFLGLMLVSIDLLLVLLFVVQRFTVNLMPVGWSSLMVTVLIIGGVQLLALGMIGGYLSRALSTRQFQPQYVIAEKAGFSELDCDIQVRVM